MLSVKRKKLQNKLIQNYKKKWLNINKLNNNNQHNEKNIILNQNITYFHYKFKKKILKF